VTLVLAYGYQSPLWEATVLLPLYLIWQAFRALKEDWKLIMNTSVSYAGWPDLWFYFAQPITDVESGPVMQRSAYLIFLALGITLATVLFVCRPL